LEYYCPDCQRCQRWHISKVNYWFDFACVALQPSAFCQDSATQDVFPNVVCCFLLLPLFSMRRFLSYQAVVLQFINVEYCEDGGNFDVRVFVY